MRQTGSRAEPQSSKVTKVRRFCRNPSPKLAGSRSRTAFPLPLRTRAHAGGQAGEWFDGVWLDDVYLAMGENLSDPRPQGLFVAQRQIPGRPATQRPLAVARLVGSRATSSTTISKGLSVT